MNTITVFPRKELQSKGYGYRIPSLAVLKDGSLIACADERVDTIRDNPNRIDKVVTFSSDGGKTWSPQIYAVREHGTKKENASAALDPSLLVDGDTVYMIYCHTPAKTFILNNKKGLGVTKDNDYIVTNGKTKYALKDGALYLDGKKTEYLVNEDGDVSKDGSYICNIYIGDGAFNEYATSFLMLAVSHDSGKTWDKPICLNNQVKAPNMCFIGPGPGVGIKLQYGEKKGRLVFPIYYSTGNWPLMMTCAMIYSDDGGKTWTRGATPNDLRSWMQRTFPNFIPNTHCLTENQVVERKDGSLVVFMRNHTPKRCIASAVSKDGGETWQDLKWHEDITNPICQVSAISFDYKGQEVIAVCCAHEKTCRKKGIIRLSVDGGETFPYSYVITEDEFVYSSMAVTDETLHVLYEPTMQHTHIDFVSIPLSEIFKF